MAKKEKVAMFLKDGVEVHDLDELQANFDLLAVMDYFREGTLLQWLDERYYDDEAEKVEELSEDTSNLGTKLCAIFGVEVEDSDIDMEGIARLKEKQRKLKELTDDKEIINNAVCTALNQEDLAELLDDECPIIYLCGEKFTISARRVRNTKFIGILNTSPEIVIKAASMAELEEKGLSFKAVKLPEKLVSPQLKMLKNVINVQAKKILNSGYNSTSRLGAQLFEEYKSALGDNNSNYRKFESDYEKQQYIDVICQRKYILDDVLIFYALEDYTYGFAFTTDSFCYLTYSARGIIKYTDITHLETSYGMPLNGEATYLEQYNGWNIFGVLKSVCRAIGVNVS